ncbi:hypothetical protein BpHYR1_036788 [Brachionus plicatilis]|uniref:Uncharacterized protein n=1 Tax=Brachionus plicatilis TaxID=10195 RepID=A0A3M7QHC6_BRAPC|nr:hypothetical protein BpHYR1_036788 [Brachionus plicatilis]
MELGMSGTGCQEKRPNFEKNTLRKKEKLIFKNLSHIVLIRSINTCSNTSNEGDRIDGPKGTNVNITSGDEDKSPRRLIKVLLGGSNVYSACNGYLTSVIALVKDSIII